MIRPNLARGGMYAALRIPRSALAARAKHSHRLCETCSAIGFMFCMTQHMQNGDYQSPAGALKTKVSRKPKKSNTSQTKLVFS